ncbi:cytochrome c3 family protein [Histidinibacterium aquaticum]|uniref:Uncharacterized protein n=1 Tax=Histidinibacterium aquaticum TaxID=2613962 RepID=A0A5J5GMC3_9RHOB|nr:cytochrome c3 family protein [Histidinibacterium aquaticum]KAA9009409.1 hypothetical protein F3S47_09210 [Histidinibacterium aquaticum]
MIRTGAAFTLLAILASPGAAQTDAEQIVQDWVRSAHADAAAEAFAHWNGEGEIPAECAVCHSGAGFRDFHGLDGSAAGSVDASIEPGGVVDCDTCHTPGVEGISQITFPSGISVPPLANSATCMTCHQGRSSGPALVERFGDLDPDAPSAELAFQNPHYAAAAATNFGTEVKGLYEYMGREYVGRFDHVDGADTCIACHDPHTLEIAAESCATCHEGSEPRDIRLSVDARDYDGDGDTSEGIAAEIASLREMLEAEIMAYAEGVAGAPIGYADAYPYFFTDTNADGTIGDDEAVFPNAYGAWTPRLLAAAYNFQFVTKDPGGYAHNPHYTLQALHDSIVDLATASGRPVPEIARP